MLVGLRIFGWNFGSKTILLISSGLSGEKPLRSSEMI